MEAWIYKTVLGFLNFLLQLTNTPEHSKLSSEASESVVYFTGQVWGVNIFEKVTFSDLSIVQPGENRERRQQASHPKGPKELVGVQPRDT